MIQHKSFNIYNVINLRFIYGLMSICNWLDNEIKPTDNEKTLHFSIEMFCIH